ncbi:hypothetical protein G7K_6115-t1 [Saitoella complicata NRRL Y-17804]|uniref:Uncharacterized protein n=1 Tax=Saitoella complicata (strain BCRC 22490 / CBS 7301 / JCM 7358 / NBRC 10748 / NRRL Y-17804) TaxID=698492 RepID=A0A0E9NQ79_SAICN|nr:hypothetical protein G7K_6115-t1 [Saitoella complicata NRRL Y-17804]
MVFYVVVAYIPKGPASRRIRTPRGRFRRAEATAHPDLQHDIYTPGVGPSAILPRNTSTGTVRKMMNLVIEIAIAIGLHSGQYRFDTYACKSADGNKKKSAP